MTIQKNKAIYFIIVAVILLASCNTNREQELIPDIFVNLEINLNNQEFLPLRQDGGHVNIDGGVRGITIYHETGNKYIALERNCSFQPSASCAQVNVDGSLLFIQCPCCSSQFDFSANVISGPAILPLKEYSTILSGSFLRIQN